MAKTKEKLYDTADTIRPYVDRALHDDDLHDNLKEAFAGESQANRRYLWFAQKADIKEAFNAARDVYAELLGGRNLTATAVRAATDKEIQDSLRKTVDELRTAANRIQGKEDHSGRNTMLLLAGITVGILFNPMTGPQTRQWLMEKVTGDTSDDYSYTPPSGSNSGDSSS